MPTLEELERQKILAQMARAAQQQQNGGMPLQSGMISQSVPSQAQSPTLPERVIATAGDRANANQDFTGREAAIASRMRGGMDAITAPGAQGKQAGDVYVGPTWSEGLASGIGKGMGMYDIIKANKERKGLAQAREAKAAGQGAVDADAMYRAAQQQDTENQDRLATADRAERRLTNTIEQQGVAADLAAAAPGGHSAAHVSSRLPAQPAAHTTAALPAHPAAYPSAYPNSSVAHRTPCGPCGFGHNLPEHPSPTAGTDPGAPGGAGDCDGDSFGGGSGGDVGADGAACTAGGHALGGAHASASGAHFPVRTGMAHLSSAMPEAAVLSVMPPSVMPLSAPELLAPAPGAAARVATATATAQAPPKPATTSTHLLTGSIGDQEAPSPPDGPAVLSEAAAYALPVGLRAHGIVKAPADRMSGAAGRAGGSIRPYRAARGDEHGDN